MPATTPNPNKQQSKPESKNGERSPVKFVRLTLNKQQKADLVTWVDSLDPLAVFKWVDTMLASRGVVVSIRANEVGYQCSLTEAGKDGSPAKCLVARASTAQRAVYAAMYRDEVVLQHVWPLQDSEEEFDL